MNESQNVELVVIVPDDVVPDDFIVVAVVDDDDQLLLVSLSPFSRSLFIYLTLCVGIAFLIRVGFPFWRLQQLPRYKEIKPFAS